jgi:hypothetical protein
VCGIYPEPPPYFLDLFENANFKSISYKQYYLTPEDVMRRMVKAH